MNVNIRCPKCREVLNLDTQKDCNAITLCGHCGASINVPTETKILKLCAKSLTKNPGEPAKQA